MPSTKHEDDLWIRKDVMLGSDSGERHLIDEVDRDRTAGPFLRAVARCNGSNVPDSCMWVARTAYRFRPDFGWRERRRVRDALRGIADTSQRDMALALFDGSESGKGLLTAVRKYKVATSPGVAPK
jgi:hypothetical protein